MSFSEGYENSRKSQTPEGLSTSQWFPQAQELDEKAVADLQAGLADAVKKLDELEDHLLKNEPSGGLVKSEFEDSIPHNWLTSPGSPLHSIQAAKGWLLMAAEGDVCLDDYPHSYFTQVRSGIFRCVDHDPSHWRPPGAGPT